MWNIHNHLKNISIIYTLYLIIYYTTCNDKMLHILYFTQITINLYYTLPLFICAIKVFKDVSEFSFAGKLIKSKNKL